MSVCKIKYDWIVFSEGHSTLRGQYFTHNIHLYVFRFSRTPPCTRYRLLGSKLRCIFQKGAWLWVKFLIVKIKSLTDKDMSRPNFGESCRPLEQREVLEVLWTTYPPAATQLNVRSSRWLRPRSKGTEAWSLLGTL